MSEPSDATTKTLEEWAKAVAHSMTKSVSLTTTGGVCTTCHKEYGLCPTACVVCKNTKFDTYTFTSEMSGEYIQMLESLSAESHPRT